MRSNECKTSLTITLNLNKMKKMILLLAFVVLGTTAMWSQDKAQDRDQVRLMLVDGDMLQIKDQDRVQLHDQLTLNDGTVVYPNGTYQNKDGVKLRLKNGECLDNDGVKYSNEYQYRYTVKQENQGLSQAQIENRNQNRYQLMLIDGDVYQIRNQYQNQLQQQLNLANGTVVNPDGSYLTRDRQQLRLKDGECLNMDGTMFKNSYTQQKMLVKKNINTNKNMKKKSIQKGSSIQKSKLRKGATS